METKLNIQHNKLIHLEDAMVMYGVYNDQILEKLVSYIKCNVKNDIQVKITSHPYILVNRIILYNCRIEVEIIFFWNL